MPSIWSGRSGSRDGTWLLDHTWKGAIPFRMEDGDGDPSRWNTLASATGPALGDG